jgi:integrase
MTNRKDPSNERDETTNQKKTRKRGRRIKGTGSVYPRKDGRWGADFIVESTGKKKTLYGKTATEAQAKLDKALQEQRQGILATGPKQKLKDYMEDWFENVHKPTIYITTYVSQRGRMHRHIIPALGQIELRKLTAQRVQQFIADKVAEGLSAGYIKKIYDILHGALDNAVKWKLVPGNVCAQVTLPTVPKRKKPILSKEQIIKLVEVANTHKMGAFIKLGLMSGMRHGEMLSLRWSDIDFQTNMLSVSRNVAHPGARGYGFQEAMGLSKVILRQRTAYGKSSSPSLLLTPSRSIERLSRYRGGRRGISGRTRILSSVRAQVVTLTRGTI